MQRVSSHLLCSKSCSSPKLTLLEDCLRGSALLWEMFVSLSSDLLDHQSPVGPRCFSTCPPSKFQLHWRGRGMCTKRQGLSEVYLGDVGTRLLWQLTSFLMFQLRLRSLCSNFTRDQGGRWIWVILLSGQRGLSQGALIAGALLL